MIFVYFDIVNVVLDLNAYYLSIQWRQLTIIKLILLLSGLNFS